MKIIDVHSHVYPSKIAPKAVAAIGKFYDAPMQCSGTSEDLIASGAKIGVSTYIIHSAATTPMQVHAINEFIISECASHPDKFIGFGTLHPDMEDFSAELDYMQAHNLIGIKLHPDFQRFSISDPKLFRLYEAVQDRLPILFHAGDRRYLFSNPRRIAEVAKRYPRLKIIAAHFGGYTEWHEAAMELYKLPIHFDTSSSLFALSPDEATAMIRQAGVEKFLFGCDFPMWDHASEMERFMRLKLTESEREAILFGNAQTLLKI